jgi:hypothetical protein
MNEGGDLFIAVCAKVALRISHLTKSSDIDDPWGR